MLKSHNELTRWYVPLEPDGSVPETSWSEDDAASDAPDSAVDDAETGDGPAEQLRIDSSADPGADPYPEYPIPSSRLPKGFPEGFVPQNDPPEQPPRLHEAQAGRAGYVGGWSDWMGDDDRDEQGPAELLTLPPQRQRVGAAPRKAQAPARPERRVVLFALAGAFVLALVAIGLVFLTDLGSGSSGHTAAPVLGGSTAHAPPSTAAAATPEPGKFAPPADGCQRNGPIVSGACAGGSGSGPDAIMWFQHSYYVERSGSRAREVVAADAVVPAADQIQKGIATVPPKTTYNVQISPLADGRYSVELTEFRPDQPVAKYKQVVTTAVVDGRTVITGIAPG